MEHVHSICRLQTVKPVFLEQIKTAALSRIGRGKLDTPSLSRKIRQRLPQMPPDAAKKIDNSLPLRSAEQN